MNNWVYLLIVGIPVGVLIYFLFYHKKVVRAITNAKYLDSIDTWFANTNKTALGIEVLSNGATQDVFDAIDRGWTQVKADAIASGYTEHLDPTLYRVYVHPTCVPSPEQQIPSFLIRADNYDGTDFDQFNPQGKGVKDGKGMVYAAELVANNGVQPFSNEPASIVICPGVAENAARYGFEHILALYNDDTYYNATATHANGAGHPILPQPLPHNPTKIVNGVFMPR